MGNVDAAKASLVQARAVSEKFGGQLLLHDWFAVGEVEVALADGQIEGALTLAEAAVVRARSVGGILAEGLAERVWSQALWRLDPPHWRGAEEHLTTSLRCFEEGDIRLEAARTHVAWGEILRDRGDLTAARVHLELAAAQFETSGLT